MSLISNQRNPNLSLTWGAKGREEWVRKRERERARRNKRSRCKKWNDKRRREIRLKQISVLNKQSEETPEPFHQHFRVSVEAERDKDNHGRASEIFSGSMASGSYLLSDGAANRLKLPLSLCQEENAQLYFPRWGDGGFCVVGSFSALILAGLWRLSKCCCWFLCWSVVPLFSVQSQLEVSSWELKEQKRKVCVCCVD